MSSTLQPRQLRPLQLNPITGEPFLRLPAPHSHIIYTPPRLSDAPELVPVLNDPKVYRWVHSPPWPFTLEDGISWLKYRTTATDALLNQLKDVDEAEPDAPLLAVGGCPLEIIREQRPDGSDIYVGTCDITRAGFDWELDEEKRTKLKEENNAREAGDPEIVWTIGDYLSPTHHGQGIMSAVVKALVEQWAVPRMNARDIRPTTFVGNDASVRVFTKNGFVLTGVVRDAVTVRARGEFPAGNQSINVLEYR